MIPKKEVPKGRSLYDLYSVSFGLLNVLASLWEHVMRCFKGICFPLCPLSVLDSVDVHFLVHVEQRHTSTAITLEPAWVLFLFAALRRPSLEEGERQAALQLHLVSQILHRAAFNLSACSEPLAIPVVTAFTTTFRGVCNRNVVWIFCDCNSGNL